MDVDVKKGTALGLVSEGRSSNPGANLLSPAKDYHGPWMLNGRVRNGNGWGHPGKRTEKSLAVSTGSDKSSKPDCLRRCPEPRSGSMRSSAWLLVPVGSDPCGPYTPGLSTWSSSRSLRWLPSGRPVLAGGFTLRCLQRLSRPHVGYPALPR